MGEVAGGGQADPLPRGGAVLDTPVEDPVGDLRCQSGAAVSDDDLDQVPAVLGHRAAGHTGRPGTMGSGVVEQDVQHGRHINLAGEHPPAARLPDDLMADHLPRDRETLQDRVDLDRHRLLILEVLRLHQFAEPVDLGGDHGGQRLLLRPGDESVHEKPVSRLDRRQRRFDLVLPAPELAQRPLRLLQVGVDPGELDPAGPDRRLQQGDAGLAQCERPRHLQRHPGHVRTGRGLGEQDDPALAGPDRDDRARDSPSHPPRDAT